MPNFRSASFYCPVMLKEEVSNAQQLGLSTNNCITSSCQSTVGVTQVVAKPGVTPTVAKPGVTPTVAKPR